MRACCLQADVRYDKEVGHVYGQGAKFVRSFRGGGRKALGACADQVLPGATSGSLGLGRFPARCLCFLSAFFFANFAQAESEQIRSAPKINQTAGWMPSTGACPARSTMPMHIIAKPRITDPIFMGLALSDSVLLTVG